MTQRKYLPTFADLCDRLSIVILKSVFIPEHHAAYMEERALIEHDIDLILQPKPEKAVTGWYPITAKQISALMILMLSNRYIWENEAAVRKGDPAMDWASMLRMTHSINGVRNAAKNVLAKHLGERVDLKIDCLAADLQEFFGEDWNIFGDSK
jgi:hypothetical protein